MIWLKVLAPIFTLATYFLEKRLETKWQDQTTATHNWAKNILHAFIALSAIASIFIIWQEDSNSQFLEEKVSLLIAKEDSSRKFAENQEENAKKDRVSLIKKIDTLQTMLNPFVKIAQTKRPHIRTELALALLVEEIEAQKKTVSALQNYSVVAKLNIWGVTGTAGIGLKESSSISRLMEGTLLETNGKVYPKCDSKSMTQFMAVISQYPKFPFSYYAMAVCLHKQGDIKWRSYAIQGVAIFRNTTLIDEHHIQHDQALEELQRLLTQ